MNVPAAYTVDPSDTSARTLPLVSARNSSISAPVATSNAARLARGRVVPFGAIAWVNVPPT